MTITLFVFSWCKISRSLSSMTHLFVLESLHRFCCLFVLCIQQHLRFSCLFFHIACLVNVTWFYPHFPKIPWFWQNLEYFHIFQELTDLNQTLSLGHNHIKHNKAGLPCHRGFEVVIGMKNFICISFNS